MVRSLLFYRFYPSTVKKKSCFPAPFMTLTTTTTIRYLLTSCMENAQPRHFCAAAWSCAFASTQSPGPFPAKCRFFQNGASVFK